MRLKDSEPQIEYKNVGHTALSMPLDPREWTLCHCIPGIPGMFLLFFFFFNTPCPKIIIVH